MNVDEYQIDGSTLLHQNFTKDLIRQVLLLGTEDGKGYERTLCGGMDENSGSTIEISDVDINSRFYIDTDMIEVKPAGDFLYHIIVSDARKEEMDKKVLLMQRHPQNVNIEEDFLKILKRGCTLGEIIKRGKTKSVEKSYIKRKEGTYLSSHVARWQLVGVIRAMKDMKIDVDDSSRTAAEVGLENGVYNVMMYDSMVCRRGIWRPGAFKEFLERELKRVPNSGLNDSMINQFLDLFLCFYPPTGIQIDYTAGLIIMEEAIPREAKQWVGREGDWPSKELKENVMKRGAHLVPKSFKDETNKKDSYARRWRLNFDLNLIIFDPSYSKKIDVRRILIILKDLKNYLLTSLMNSYHIKVAIAAVMYKYQDKRIEMTNRGMILYVLMALKEAYKSMKLDDFFNPKFNHLHRNKDKKIDFDLLSKEIEKIIKNFDLYIDRLQESQRKFNKYQSDKVQTKIQCLIPSCNMKPNSPSCKAFSKSLMVLFPRIEVQNLLQMCCWMIKNTSESSKLMRVNESPISQEDKSWQSILKIQYEKILFGNNFEKLSDYSTKSQPDVLSRSILDNFLANAETIKSTKMKFKIWREIEDTIHTEMKCEIIAFGSSFTSYAIKGSDIDLMIYPENRDDKLGMLKQIQSVLKTSSIILEDSKFIEAKIPVLKCVHSESGISIDLVIAGKNDSTRVRSAHLFYHYATCDWRFRPLIVALKIWAKEMDINNPTNHGLSSHALTIMLVHYLVSVVTTPPILCDLQDEYPDFFGRDIAMENIKFCPRLRRSTSKNEMSLSELFFGFLSYFSSFDTKKYGLTLGGKCERLHPMMHITRDSSSKYQYFLVQDPYDLRNAARAICKQEELEKVQLAFKASTEIGKTMGNQIELAKFCKTSYIFIY